MSEGFRLRVGYEIRDRLAFLSHLETVHSMERVVRRANLPFAITQGFSPHMKIAFGPALPVGAGSSCEYFDVRLKEFVEPAQALDALKAAAPANLMPISCEYIPHDADAIDVAYPVSVWEAAIDLNDAAFKAVDDAFTELVDRGYIEVEKKKGCKVTVKRVEFDGRLIDGPHLEDEGGRARVRFSTFQGNEGALRPDKFIAAALDGVEGSPQRSSLMRIALREAF